MYAVGDAQSHMSQVVDGGGEENFSQVRRGGCSPTPVLSGGWGRRGGSLAYTQWGMLSETCP